MFPHFPKFKANCIFVAETSSHLLRYFIDIDFVLVEYLGKITNKISQATQN